MEGTAPLQGCLARLRGIFSALTAAEGRVAETILENPQQIIHLSITELADRANSAEATIFRLCKRLGYAGYQSFKIALASDLVTPMQNIHEAILVDALSIGVFLLRQEETLANLQKIREAIALKRY